MSRPPAGKIVDARGANVYPGFIDASTDLGLIEPGVRGYDDVSEMLEFNQMLRTRVAYQSDSDAIPVARVEGITSAGIFMTGGVVSGDVPFMNLDGWTWEEKQVRPTVGLTMAFPGGAGGGRGGGGGGGGGRGRRRRRQRRSSRSRSAVRAGPRVHGQRQPHDGLEPRAARAGRSRRSRSMFIQAGTEQAVRDAIAWAERQGINIVIRTSPAAAVAQAALLKAKNVPVIISTVLAMPAGEDTFHAATYQAAGELAKAGVTFAFSSGNYENVRLVPFQAAMSVAWGLSHDDAIKALTINAAKIFGADKAIGSLEAGKIANLLVVAGDPLEIRSRIRTWSSRGAMCRSIASTPNSSSATCRGSDHVTRSFNTKGTKHTKGTKSTKWISGRASWHLSRKAVIAAAVLVGTFAFGATGTATQAGPTYALKGVRIFTAAGAPIENGTILMRDGVIQDVGASVTVPADAMVIDGAGMNAYPGLIDMGNDAPIDTGEEAAPAAAAGRGGGGRRRRAAGPGRRLRRSRKPSGPSARRFSARTTCRPITCAPRAPSSRAWRAPA